MTDIVSENDKLVGLELERKINAKISPIHIDHETQTMGGISLSGLNAPSNHRWLKRLCSDQ